MRWLRRFVAGLSPQGPWFDLSPVCMVLMADRVALSFTEFPVGVTLPLCMLDTGTVRTITFKRSNALSDIRKRWREEYFHIAFWAPVFGVEEPTEISLHKGVQSMEVKLPCFLYSTVEMARCPLGAIATIMAELASRSTRSGVPGHSVIRLIGSYNVLVDIIYLTGVVGQNH